MDKRFLGILAGVAVVFIGIFAISQHSSNKGASDSTNTAPTNHVEGQGAAKVTLTEYGDYECPICEEYYQPLKQVEAQLSSQIYFQFRNLPLTSIHPNAFAGARAAEAASLQGKFWQMHDTLYDNQTAWANSTNPKPYFDTYAKTLGLNVSQFDSDCAGSQVNNSINADLAAFAKTGEQEATPSIFLDGKFVQYSSMTDSNGLPDATKILALLEAEIASKAKS